MAPEALDRVLSDFDPERREMLRRLLVGSAWALPFVASFSLDGLGGVADAAGFGSNMTQSLLCSPEALVCSNLSFGPNIANVQVQKCAAPVPLADGSGQILYEINVLNCSQEDAYNVIVTDNLPPDVAFVSAVQSGGATTFSLATPAVGEAGGVFEATAATMIASDLCSFEIVVEPV